MSDNKITPEEIQNLLDSSKTSNVKMGDKTTVVLVTLPSGFEIVGTGSCVALANYNHDVGIKIAMDQIKNKLWELEGYALQNEIHFSKVLQDKVDEDRS